MKYGFNQPSGFRGEKCLKILTTQTYIHVHIRTTEAYLHYKLTNEPLAQVSFFRKVYGRECHDHKLQQALTPRGREK